MNSFVKVVLAVYAFGIFLGYLHGLRGLTLLGAGFVAEAFIGVLVAIVLAIGIWERHNKNP